MENFKSRIYIKQGNYKSFLPNEINNLNMSNFMKIKP